MSDGQMTYEDWLRGCVHHDGRNGYVTLPCDEVIKIADFIEKLRADRKTEPSFKVDGIGDDDPTIHAIAHLQKVGWLQEHDRALTEPQKMCDANCNEDCIECAKETELWKAEQTEPQTEVRYSNSTDYQGAVDYVTDTDCSWK